MSRPVPTSEHDAVFSALLDDRLDDAEFARTTARIASDPEFRRAYIRYVDLHADLATRFGETSGSVDAAEKVDSSGDTFPLSPRERAGVRANFRFGPALALSVAAALLVSAAAVAIYVFVGGAAPERPAPEPMMPVATLIETAGGELTTPHDYPSEGRQYAAGRYTLSAGSAEFMLTSAVNVKLRGATQIVMHNDMSVTLARGEAAFVVPPNAIGFTVRLPDDSRIVDLGTAFVVGIDEDGRPTVKVTEGKVELTAADPSGERPAAHLSAGEAASKIDGRAWTRRIDRMRVDLGIANADASPPTPENPNDHQLDFFAADVDEAPGKGSGRVGLGALADSIDGLSLVIDDSAGTLEWRDRPVEVEGERSALIEEFAFARNDEQLVLTIAGLEVGRAYTLTTFHHDASIDVGTTDWRIEHDANDAAGESDEHGIVVQSTGEAPTLRRGYGMLRTTFVARSGSITLRGRSTTDESTNISILNGFVLAEHVPLHPAKKDASPANGDPP